MSKNRTGLYLGLAVAGAGGYYLYRSGGDVEGAKKEMKFDVNKARDKVGETGESAEKKGKNFGKEAGAAVDDAVNKTRTTLDERIPQKTQEGINKAEELRKDARQKFHEGVDKMDRTVEQKAAETKGTVSGWFSSGNK
ncbi:hypothetical protein N7474_009824 [Penicillium riverlandense]|uniref:uncharacterized protein n=1 Tax=Penicillium riverlandense TaxID=1903569 RepID=UPI00254980D2|nr:uncharacterized protein N7474_009824 [Penicillium riverlandense]KAJ5808555.1 hypothetical protein N7474_009824 [Penicillium riverlandense]